MKFLKDESGAATVEWVVLAAALVIIGGAIMAAVGPLIEAEAQKLDNQIQGAVSAVSAAT